jgi:hypothetical protein
MQILYAGSSCTRSCPCLREPAPHLSSARPAASSSSLTRSTRGRSSASAIGSVAALSSGMAGALRASSALAGSVGRRWISGHVSWRRGSTVLWPVELPGSGRTDPERGIATLRGRAVQGTRARTGSVRRESATPSPASFPGAGSRIAGKEHTRTISFRGSPVERTVWTTWSPCAAGTTGRWRAGSFSCLCSGIPRKLRDSHVRS